LRVVEMRKNCLKSERSYKKLESLGINKLDELQGIKKKKRKAFQ